MNKLKAVAMSTLVLSVASKSYAFDGHPGDYLWLPDHSAVALIYGQYQSADSFKVDGGNTVPKSKLEAATSIVRGVYFRDLGRVKCPQQFDFRATLPRDPPGKLMKRLLKAEYEAR